MGADDRRGAADKMIFKRKSKVLWREVDGQGVLVDLRTGTYYSLNQMGLKIWSLLNGKNSVEKIRRAIVSFSGAPEAKVRKDLNRFFSALEKPKLIVRMR